MDITFLQTFLEVAKQRHFGKAADTLYITQSTVSARIKLLESTLGVELFNRKRNDIQLTGAGKKLQKHAETIVAGWGRARQDLIMEPDVKSALIVGFPVDIWSIAVADVVNKATENKADIAFDLQAHPQLGLGEKVVSGMVDVAVLYDPPQLPELEIQQLCSMRLSLFSTAQHQSLETAISENYIYVDWGINYAMQHAQTFADSVTPSMRTSNGSIALDQLKRHGGAAYLPQKMLEGVSFDVDLYPVEGAETFERYIFAIYRADRNDLKILRGLFA